MLQRLIMLGSLLCACWTGAVSADPPSPPEESDAGEAPADSACPPGRVEEVVARIQAKYDAIRDLRAEFVQTSESVVLSGMSLGDAEATRGRVVFAKPGRMRWHYVEPYESYVISDGKTLWIYDVAARQANKLAVERGYLAGAALQFLLGDGKLAESFFVSGRRCEPERTELDLLPREPASYERLGLTADRATDLIVDTTITDLFGNRTRIRFEAIALDQSPDAAEFGFEPPDGVEVIELSFGP